jgi:hypothetical protein
MKNNWVESRWLRESNLTDDAPAVWQSVATAIGNTCDAFNAHYSHLATVDHNAQNGCIVVTVHRKIIPARQMIEISVRIVLEQNRISVIEGYHDAPRHFQIASDETHAFLKYGEKEITADEFSELALENVFFNTSNWFAPNLFAA